MSLLEVSNLNVHYGDLQALYDVSLKIEEGEIVSMIGANGAGKTTMIKTISGLLSPTSGKIRFLGERIDGLPPHYTAEKGIIQIPEGRGIFPFLTVLENLTIGAYTPRARQKMDQSLEMVFEMFPVLEERKTQLGRTLSGGEQQMLAIGRGLMARPRLLMVDEPSLGLAPILVKKVFEILRQINTQGITIFLVEQNVKQSLNLCNRGYVLENGRVVLEGVGREVLEDERIKKAYLGL